MRLYKRGLMERILRFLNAENEMLYVENKVLHVENEILRGRVNNIIVKLK